MVQQAGGFPVAIPDHRWFRKGRPMKKLVAFALILSLGLMTVGCNPPAPPKKVDDRKPPAGPVDKGAPGKPAPNKPLPPEKR